MESEDFFSNLNDNLITKPVDELKVEHFSSKVACGEIKFLTVVESLKGVLTNENVNIREKGIEFLSWLLSELPKSLFNCSEINVLSNFYCDCLKGHHNFLSSTIRGLLELAKMMQIAKDNLIKILVNLFQHVNCQSQLQPDRILIYTFLKFIIENHLENVNEMGPDFVFGVISLFEGEADPFCLMIIFNFLPVFIKNFQLGHLSEEMFEILSCYFPIDFNPSASENILITREDLSEGLHQCLSAISSFSEQSILLILEKSDSTFKNAKLDSYKLLRECCKTLKLESLEKHINPLWKQLSKDVLPGHDKSVCDAGLLALTEIFHLLSRDESHEKILTIFLEDIFMTIKSLTNRIDENMFQPAIKVLVAAAFQSKLASVLILCHLEMFPQLKSNNTFMGKKNVLSSLIPLLRICSDFKLMESQDGEVKSNYFSLVTLYLDAAVASDYETRKLGFSGISEILLHSTQEFQERLHEILLENIKTKEDIRTSEELIKTWRGLAQNHQTELYNFITKRFVIKEADSHFTNFLWALSIIADLPKFTGFVIPTFMTFIASGRNYLSVLESLLNTCKIAESKMSLDFFQVIHSEYNALDHLISWCLHFKPKEKLREGKTLPFISEIVVLVMRNQNSKTQQVIVDEISKMFLGEASRLSSSNDFSDKNSVTFSSDQVPDVLIVESVLCSVRSEISIPMIQTYQEKLTNIALNATDEAVCLSSSRVLATLVNKSEESLSLKLLSAISKDIFAHLEDNCDLRKRFNASVLFTWVVKGVILRGSCASEEWISTWFTLLGRKDIGEAIAEGFRTVFEENDLYLSLESHCNVRVLYRQRLFGSLPKLVKMYETSEWSVRMNYLLALVRLLQGVPIHLIQTEISNIITILSLCLDVDKPEVLLTSLEILTGLLATKEIIFSDYILSFVPKFLKLARFEDVMKIRINALKCLYFYGFYPTTVLLPTKTQVIRELEFCLDDKKRLVRKEAVKARCRWFLVGAPGEDILDS